MTTVPDYGAPAPGRAGAAVRGGEGRRGPGSPVPTAGMVAAKVMELRKRRGLMVAVIAATGGLPALFMVARVLLHAFAPRSNPPAGGNPIFVILAAGFLPTFSFIAAVTLGCTAGSRDLSEGMFRHLVVTGRSRLALYLARIPAGLAILVPLVAVGYTILCAVCYFAAPGFVDIGGSNVNAPAGLSRAAFENWARDRAEPVICFLPNSGHVPKALSCPGPPYWSKSAVTPAQPASPRLEALSARIARRDYGSYRRTIRRPSVSLMLTGGLWIELGATAGFVIGLGLASLMGQRLAPVILLLVFQLILTPIVSAANLVRGLQAAVLGLAVSHLEPHGLPLVYGLPGVSGGVRGPGSGYSPVPGSTPEAVGVIIAWLVVWTALGAWRMMTRDA